MAILANSRHERFAQGLAKGKPAYIAHKDADLSGDRGDASKLQRNPSIVQRVSEIIDARGKSDARATEKAVEALAIDKEWVLARLVENAERAMQAVQAKSADGQSGDYKYEGSVANRALELIGKEMGMFVDRKEVGKPGDFERMSDDELDRFITERARASGARASGKRTATGKSSAGGRERLN